jgi:hypothetical protein
MKYCSISFHSTSARWLLYNWPAIKCYCKSLEEDFPLVLQRYVSVENYAKVDLLEIHLLFFRNAANICETVSEC